MNWSVSFGSWPSRPTTISRAIVALGGAGIMMKRHNARKGHAKSESTTTMTVVKSTKADDMRAKPAPGPMYAEAGAALASVKTNDSAVVSQNAVRVVMTLRSL